MQIRSVFGSHYGNDLILNAEGAGFLQTGLYVLPNLPAHPVFYFPSYHKTSYNPDLYAFGKEREDGRIYARRGC